MVILLCRQTWQNIVAFADLPFLGSAS